ncbi:MAG: fatty acid desaturase [Pseudomonadales bacterium]|nr:fatty acid desaturase [Pseudomonadales bacterium]
MWDIDRTRLGDLMLYQWRFLLFMTGISSLIELRRESGVHPAVDRARARLGRGMAIYWICVPTGILALLIVTGSSVEAALLFLFLVYLQPLFAMSTFLSIINIGQHGFFEFDAAGRHVKHVTSTTIVDGPDDSFGEDYHVAHHYFPGVDHDGFSEHVARERPAWAHCNGTVFENTTFFEIAIMMVRGQFDRLIRDHYVDFSGERTVEEHGER